MNNRLIAYASTTRVVDGEERTFRTRIGTAFPHKRADGYTILINDNISVSGRFVLFPPFTDERQPNPPPEPATGERGDVATDDAFGNFVDDIPF